MEIDYLQLAAAKHGAKKEDLLASFVNDERAVIVLPSGKKFTYSCAELAAEAEQSEAAAGEAGKASPKPAQRSTAAKRSRSAKK
jgi:hypothetical protein